MKNWIGALVCACTIVLAGCSSQQPATETVTVAPPTTALNSLVVASASALGGVLTSHGAECTVSKPVTTAKASIGSCTLASASGSSGVPVQLWVWKTPSEAMAGLAAWLAVPANSGHHYISGANWIADFGVQGVAAAQVWRALGDETNLGEVS